MVHATPTSTENGRKMDINSLPYSIPTGHFDPEDYEAMGLTNSDLN